MGYGQQNAYQSFLKEACKTARIYQIPSICGFGRPFWKTRQTYIVMD